MELSCINMFVHNHAFTGIMKITYIREFHILKLKIDFYRILTTDVGLIGIVAKSCREDPVSPNALKLVSTELIYSKIMDYYEAEAFRNYLHFVNFRDFLADQQSGQMWEIEFKFERDLNHFKILLTTNEVLRLYNHINSFYSNYLTHDLTLKILYNSDKLKPAEAPKENKKITEFVPSADTNQQIKKEIEIKSQVEFTEKSEFDDIFNLCLTTPIKSSLIHYTLSYFRFFNSDQCKLLVSSKGQVKIISPILMPGNFNIDETYFRSLILSSNLHINNITFVIKKIFSILLQEHEKYKDKPLHIMMLLYLSFLYLMRYFYEVHRDNFRESFSKIICNPNSQKLLFMGLIRNTFTEFQNKLFFEFVPGNYEKENTELDNVIEELSKQYKHLIPLSQEEFADRIFNNLIEISRKDNRLPADFKISNKKVLNIENYLKINNGNGKSLVDSYFFDPEKTLSPVEISDFHEFKYLDYKLIPSPTNDRERIISEAYKYLLNYIKNPSSILLIKDNKIPKNIINLFDLLSKTVLSKDKITKETISTFYYYNLLVDSLPDSAVFKHSQLLYIIYQIIIPYHYDVYHNTEFIDVFL